MDIPPEMLRVYEAAIYLVHWPDRPRRVAFGEITRPSDVPVPCREGFAIVTPDNPFSRPTPAAENEAARAALRRAVAARDLASWPSEGRDPTGAWPVEHGLAVLDPDPGDLDDWMVRFGQNAVLELPLGFAARLRLHPAARDRASLDGVGTGGRR